MIIQGRRPIAGISSNADSAPVDWSFTWFTPANAAQTVATGQLVPLSGSIQHSADTRVIRDNRGNEVTVFWTNEKVIIEVVAVPLGAADGDPNTLAAAVSAAKLPAPGGWVTIANAPSVDMGSFTNVFNSANWMYNGDGRIELVSDGEWGLRFSCTQRANLAKTAGVTV